MKRRTFLQTMTTASLAVLLGVSAYPSANAQRQGAGRNGGRFGGGAAFGMVGRNNMMNDPTMSSITTLLARPDVQRLLEITIKQKEAIQEMQGKSRDEMRQRMATAFQNQGNLTPEERAAQRDQIQNRMLEVISGFMGDMDKKLEEILRPEQMKRLRELDLQWRGPLALGDPKLNEKLEVTPEQKEKITALVQEYRAAQQKAMMSAFQGFRGRRGQNANGGDNTAPTGPPTREEMQAKMKAANDEVEKARKTIGDKVLQLLSDKQNDQWQAMLGKPFVFRKLDTQ